MSGVNIDFNIDEKTFACGGIAGAATSIENCEAEGKISANNCEGCDIGGIVGYGHKIYRCKNDINIDIETEIHGLIKELVELAARVEKLKSV